MLLSRVAECLYWGGRYLERAEATARLIKVHTELYLDLPRSANLGWSPLLAVTGSWEGFRTGHAAADEDEVISFLTVNANNPGSIIASIAQARHDLRTTQAMLPAAAWHVLNEMHLWAMDTRDNAVHRRTRMTWMDEVIARCHHLSGLVTGTMSHDDCYSFLEVGRLLERADMTTRVLDVQAGILLQQLGEGSEPYGDVTWMSALRALAAGQMFRRASAMGAPGPQALRFLLKDPAFPRSVEHCLIGLSRALLELPHSEEPMAGCARLQTALEDTDVASLTGSGLHRFVDRLQLGIAEL
ncbi:MAG: alpha-E domain-containing protein, partial [Actinobacteria bacterium]|nr:alpha-E domain-containing protein [Actinomycetota bacterium]